MAWDKEMVVDCDRREKRPRRVPAPDAWNIPSFYPFYPGPPNSHLTSIP